MKSGNLVMKFLMFVMAVFLAAFAGYHAYRHFFSSYTTVDAYRHTVYHTAVVDGILIRSEQSLNQKSGEHMRYVVEDGEKVKVGTPLAYTYASEASLNEAQRRAELQDELDLLLKVESLIKANNIPTVTDLSRNTDVSLSALAEAVALGDYTHLDDLILQVQEQVNIGAALTGSTKALEERIDKLESTASKQMSSSVLYSSREGYFSYSVDGFEKSYSTDLIGNISAEQLQQMLQQEYPLQEDTLGKVVNGTEWYYVTTVPADRAGDFPEGSAVTVSFAGSTADAVNARVLQVQQESPDADAVITLVGNEVNADTVSRRCSAARISSPAYVGIRFDQKYLRISDGVKGVYVDAGYTVKFKPVDIIYEGDGYYLSRLNYTGEDYLNIFDRLIDTKADLHDGMSISDL